MLSYQVGLMRLNGRQFQQPPFKRVTGTILNPGGDHLWDR
jgi:hypothetical protein